MALPQTTESDGISAARLLTRPAVPHPDRQGKTGDPPNRRLVNVTLPVHNGAAYLERAVVSVWQFLHSRYPFEIVIAENGSTDQTRTVARALAAKFDAVRLMETDRPGRGRALTAAWLSSKADVLSYMDVDLATELACFPKLIGALEDADIAVGSRLDSGAVVQRGLKRELISRAYNLLVRTLFTTPVRDMQCGFKAMNAEVARRLLPMIKDPGFFWDTELLLKASALGLKIASVPVNWRDSPTSSVNIIKTAWADLCGLRRVRKEIRYIPGLLTAAGQSQQPSA